MSRLVEHANLKEESADEDALRKWEECRLFLRLRGSARNSQRQRRQRRQRTLARRNTENLDSKASANRCALSLSNLDCDPNKSARILLFAQKPTHRALLRPDTPQHQDHLDQ
jgi:hypothetical protein